jgi:hypothetical protein
MRREWNTYLEPLNSSSFIASPSRGFQSPFKSDIMTSISSLSPGSQLSVFELSSEIRLSRGQESDLLESLLMLVTSSSQAGCLPSFSALSSPSLCSMFELSPVSTPDPSPSIATPSITSPYMSPCGWGKSPILRPAVISLASQSTVTAISPLSLSSVFDLSQSIESSQPSSTLRSRRKSLVALSSAPENQSSALPSISATSPLSLCSVFDLCRELTSTESIESSQSDCLLRPVMLCVDKSRSSPHELPQISILSSGPRCSTFDLSQTVEAAHSGSLAQTNLHNTGKSICALTRTQDDGKESLCVASASFCSNNILPVYDLTKQSESLPFQSSDSTLEGLSVTLKESIGTQKMYQYQQAAFGSKDIEYLHQVLTSPSMTGVFSLDINDSSKLEELLSNKMSCFTLLQCCAQEIAKMRKQMDLMAQSESLHNSQAEIDFLKMKLDATNGQVSACKSETEKLKKEMIFLKEEIDTFNHQTIPTTKVEGVFKAVLDTMQSLKENTDRDSSEKIERALTILKRKISITLGVKRFKSNGILLQISNHGLKTLKAQPTQQETSVSILPCQVRSYNGIPKHGSKTMLHTELKSRNQT